MVSVGVGDIEERFVKMNNKIAIGCLVQWYEIELVQEYIESVNNALELIDHNSNVTVDFVLVINQDLEKISNEITMDEIQSRFIDLVKGFNYRITDELYTIADYRRDFNNEYCTKVDVLMWGETDALIPRQTFRILDNLHSNVRSSTPKYVGFFSTCKMWDDSWTVLEHPEFTVKPFIDMSTVDTKNWWSLRYNMNIDEMNAFNDKVEDLDVRILDQYKFNGCGLVISSDVVKSGVNIPKSSFFIHEDTAFQLQLQRFFQGKIPQYLFKNILLVHNRKHVKKRFYIKGEEGVELGDVTAGRKKHEWYRKASEMSHHNTYNMFTQSKIYSWEDIL